MPRSDLEWIRSELAAAIEARPLAPSLPPAGIGFVLGRGLTRTHDRTLDPDRLAIAANWLGDVRRSTRLARRRRAPRKRTSDERRGRPTHEPINREKLEEYHDDDCRPGEPRSAVHCRLGGRAPSAYELLYRLGLERRRSRAMRAASRAGWIGVGMALGSGLAMLFTPRSGPEVRERLGEQAKRARDYVAPHEDEPRSNTARSPRGRPSDRPSERV